MTPPDLSAEAREMAARLKAYTDNGDAVHVWLAVQAAALLERIAPRPGDCGPDSQLLSALRDLYDIQEYATGWSNGVEHNGAQEADYLHGMVMDRAKAAIKRAESLVSAASRPEVVEATDSELRSVMEMAHRLHQTLGAHRIAVRAELARLRPPLGAGRAERGGGVVSYSVNLVACTSVLLNEIEQGLRQKDITLTYAMAIMSEDAGVDEPDWKAINAAIRAKWSDKALNRIKTAAWKLIEERRRATPRTGSHP